MREPSLDIEANLADLRRVAVADLPALTGDGVLEETLRRLRREAEAPRDAVSGFASAI